MKIWIVTRNGYSTMYEWYTEGYFTTREKADLFISKQSTEARGDYCIDEQLLDQGI